MQGWRFGNVGGPRSSQIAVKNAQGKMREIYSCLTNFGSNLHDFKSMIIFNLMDGFVDLILSTTYTQSFRSTHAHAARAFTLGFQI